MCAYWLPWAPPPHHAYFLPHLDEGGVIRLRHSLLQQALNAAAGQLDSSRQLQQCMQRLWWAGRELGPAKEPLQLATVNSTRLAVCSRQQLRQRPVAALRAMQLQAGLQQLQQHSGSQLLGCRQPQQCSHLGHVLLALQCCGDDAAAAECCPVCCCQLSCWPQPAQLRQARLFRKEGCCLQHASNLCWCQLLGCRQLTGRLHCSCVLPLQCGLHQAPKRATAELFCCLGSQQLWQCAVAPVLQRQLQQALQGAHLQSNMLAQPLQCIFVTPQQQRLECMARPCCSQLVRGRQRRQCGQQRAQLAAGQGPAEPSIQQLQQFRGVQLQPGAAAQQLQSINA